MLWGNCLLTRADYPEPGITGFRCYLDLSNLPPEYVGGQLTTNSINSRNTLGGVSDPPDYVQASIATVRLWKRRDPRTAASPSGAAVGAASCAARHDQGRRAHPARCARANVAHRAHARRLETAPRLTMSGRSQTITRN
jgi:hypothetical protein